MARLIDADKIMDELMDYADRKCANGYMDTANGILSAVNYIRNNVTRVDAVPVVRCRDCKIRVGYKSLATEEVLTIASCGSVF